MKINYRKVILWIAIIICVAVLPDGRMYYQQYKLSLDKLPDTYKTYAELDSLKDDVYEVLEINSDLAEPVVQLMDSSIMIAYKSSIKTENGDSTKAIWYKINLEGEIDSASGTAADVAGGKELNYLQSTYEIDTVPGLIRREFVHKEHWSDRSFWNLRKNLMWGTGNGSGGGGWTGTSYFQIKMPEKTLHFKRFVAIDEDGDFRDRFFYFVYQVKNGKYLLLSDLPSRRYYLIRPIKRSLNSKE
ncbi:hypothetical protein [Pedobacter caeni]|uniref:Uncharacterized protein n=1 Tax=Pedobacter caeni TaxID=288992 RepID=A0A1M4UE81_9SPHI|nr:hypothetical protein [Pedobacter caeni]SHE55069.1 hypothetical protein SAMN04488522_101527 [Pedobacter caeni]